MRTKRWFAIFGLLMALMFAFSACQQAPTTAPATDTNEATDATTAEEPAASTEKVLDYALGLGDIPTLDPSLSQDTNSIQMVQEMFPGLTQPDEVTNVLQPGMATYDISEDQTVYTFHIMDNVYWVKYDEVLGEVVQVMDDQDPPQPRKVTANDFAYGFFRTLNAETASPYVYVLNNVLVGGTEYNSAATDDERAALVESVGVKVIDDLTLELTFIAPAAYNAAIAGMWMGYAQPSWQIEEKGDRWIEPGLIQTYGPYTLKEWIHDYSATLVANPFWVGTDSIPAPKITTINMRFIDDPEALAEYEAGNMDTSNVDAANLDRIKADPVFSTELYTAPNFCSYYYGFNTSIEPTNDVRVRRALSMAVDRQSLIDNVLKGGQIPSQWIENPGLAGAPTLEKYPDGGIKYDLEAAKALLQEYLDEKGMTADQLDITLEFNTNAGHQLIAETIQSMWADGLGVTVNLMNQEWKVHLAMIDGPEASQVFRTGWCLDYPDANNFTKDLTAIGGNNNQTEPGVPGVPYGGIQWLNEDYEALIAQAAAELDPDARMDLYAQANKIAMYDDAVVIPIYWYSRNIVTKPYLTRTFSSGGHETFEKWDIDMEAKNAARGQ